MRNTAPYLILAGVALYFGSNELMRELAFEYVALSHSGYIHQSVDPHQAAIEQHQWVYRVGETIACLHLLAFALFIVGVLGYGLSFLRRKKRPAGK